MKESRVLGTGEMRGVLLPLGGRSLLLPSAAVAELIGYQAPEAETGSADWLLGHIEWRGRRVPVISFEAAIGADAPRARGQRMRIAVLNTLNGNPRLPYVGVLTLGISRLARIRVENLAADDSDSLDSELIARSITVSGQPAWIPDLERVEQWVIAAGS